MYEMFRSEVLRLLGDFSQEELAKVAEAMDITANGYTISKAETSLCVPGRQEFIDIATAYIITRKTEGITNKSIEQMARVLKTFINSTLKPIRIFSQMTSVHFCSTIRKTVVFQTVVWISYEPLSARSSNGVRQRDISQRILLQTSGLSNTQGNLEKLCLRLNWSLSAGLVVRKETCALLRPCIQRDAVLVSFATFGSAI